MNAQDKQDLSTMISCMPEGWDEEGERLRARLTHLDRLERETIPALERDHTIAFDEKVYELETERAFRDKLERALAWASKYQDKVRWCERAGRCLPSVSFGIGGPQEFHDGTPHGRAEALVRLWERVTGGTG